MKDSQTNQYSIISILNHWITAVVFLGMLGFGFYLGYADIVRETKGPLMGIHKSIGTLFLIFAFWRVGWRLFQGFPKDVSTMPAWQKFAAKTVHWLLLLGIIAMPLSGVLMSVFNNRAIDVFGLFAIPAQGKNEFIGGMAHNIHEIAPYIILFLLILHIAAALKHHIFDKDATLKRMVGINS